MAQSELPRVAVLSGGWSKERSISLNSGRAVQSALRAMAYDSVLLDLATPTNITRILQAHNFDCAFIAMHGQIGEDGCIQGLLESMAKPYTGSGVLGSAVAMNKAFSKSVWKSFALPTPQWQLLWPGFDTDELLEQLGLPVVIKPLAQGSSLGVSLVAEAREVEAAWRAAMNGHGQPVLAERYIEGEEYSVAFVNERVFSPIHVIPTAAQAFYNYAAKYEDTQTRYVCPANLSLGELAQLQSLAYQAAEVLAVDGWGRVDLRRDRDGKFWLLEVNTVPGMTEHSLVPKAAANDGVNFNQLVVEILHTAHQHRQA